MKMPLIVFIIVVIFVGCSRHVVVKPEDVSKLNDNEWTIKSKPNKNTSIAPNIKDSGNDH